jgi:hypothetical protein
MYFNFIYNYLEDKKLLENMESNILSLIDFFKELLNHSEEIHLHKNKLECDMQNMQSCLLDKLQRESNKEVCKHAIQTINDAADSCKVFITVHQVFSKQLLTFTTIDY